MDSNTDPTTPEASDAKTRYAVLLVNRRIIVGLVLLLLLGVLPGWLLLWQGNENRSPDTHSAAAAAPPPSEGQLVCAGDLKRYENSFLDIGFCYPSAWGEVLVQDATFEPADNGSRWRFDFTVKPSIALGLVSPDWSTTVPRAATCEDPAQATVPSFNSATTWRIEGKPTLSATRGIESLGGYYLIEEKVDDVHTNGVCLSGFTLVGGTYRHSVATYSAEFSPIISSPDHHIADPTVLISVHDRAEFAAFVKSIRKL